MLLKVFSNVDDSVNMKNGNESARELSQKGLWVVCVAAFCSKQT